MGRLSIPIYHPDDPACPWTEDYNPDTIMEAYEDEAERRADDRHKI